MTPRITFICGGSEDCREALRPQKALWSQPSFGLSFVDDQGEAHARKHRRRLEETGRQEFQSSSLNLKLVAAYLQGPEEAKPQATDGPPGSRGRSAQAYQKTDARVFGRRLHFRNLAYEPTNEQGVVFLFGMVSEELGFESIEYLGIDFPDCEGKWKVRGRQQLQHVRIEFEFKSGNYDHDPGGCDVIVCWEHNWEKCPASLKVIEFKKETKALHATS